MKSKNVRVYKLDLLPENTKASAMLTVREYYEKIGGTQSGIYMKIDRVLSGETTWDNFKAFRKGDNIVIIELKVKNTKQKKK